MMNLRSAFLQWYVNEQVEEEESSDNALKKVKAAGSDPDELKNVDRALGQSGSGFQKGTLYFRMWLNKMSLSDPLRNEII